VPQFVSPNFLCPNYTTILFIITVVKAVIAHIFASQAEEFEESLSARKLKTPVSGTEKQYWWWNLCTMGPQ
jgi:hypothetical protein